MKKFLRSIQITSAYTFIGSLISPSILFFLNEGNTIDDLLFIKGLVIAFCTGSISFALTDSLNQLIREIDH